MTAWRSSQETDLHRFQMAVTEALCEIQPILLYKERINASL